MQQLLTACVQIALQYSLRTDQEFRIRKRKDLHEIVATRTPSNGMRHLESNALHTGSRTNIPA